MMMPIFGVRRRVFKYDAVGYKEKRDNDFVRGSALLIKRPTSTGVFKHVH